MKRDHIEFQERSHPIGYMITIRCYGTWLHGDERGSVNRRSHNKIGTPKLRVNVNLVNSDRRSLKNSPFMLDAQCRVAVESAIREVCVVRGFGLVAINV